MINISECNKYFLATKHKNIIHFILSLFSNHHMKKESIKYWGFTIIELLTVTVILGILIPSIITIYSFMIKSNKEFNLRQTSIQQWYEFFEKLNILMQDYTIDYEEYFNRQMVWCVKSWSTLLTWDNFKWNVWLSWYCTEFTAYWNENSTNRNIWNWNSKDHDIYQCSSIDGSDAKWRALVIKKDACWRFWGKQSYGQYKALFTDVRQIIDEGDDEDLWTMVNSWVQAIEDGDNIQELYLISHDGKSRLFFRRKLFTWDEIQSQYKIQILRLRWFDAGYKHDFHSDDKRGMYDWKIDTWACDAWMGFVCNWTKINWAYTDYKLPGNADDGWIDITHGPINVYTWNISIAPYEDPDLSWADQSIQTNPYVKFFTVFGVYVPYYKWKMAESIINFKVPIQTTISTKSFYKS